MAGGSLFIWIPVLFTAVVCTSERKVVSVFEKVVTGNPDVDSILSRLKIPDGIDPNDINVTSIVIKTCEGMKETLAETQKQLQLASQRYNQVAEKALGMRSESRRLKVQLNTCLSTASSIVGTYQTQLQIKLNQMLERLDDDTRLIFKIMTLTRETSTLQKEVELTNSNRTAAEIIELQRQLKAKRAELNEKIEEANKSSSIGTLILQIISLQSQIRDAQEAESRGENAGSQTSDRNPVIQHQLIRKITELREKGDTNFANLLELISVRVRIEELKRTISDLTEKYKTFVTDAERQHSQKAELLTEKILQLSQDESNKELTMEIMQLQAELLNLAVLMRNRKNNNNVQIQELRAILEQQKQRQDVIQRELEAEDYTKSQLILQIISVMEELAQQRLTGQPTTVLEAKEKEYANALAKIRELQRKLRLLTEMGSKYVEAYENLKIDFDRKIGELNKNKEVEAALVLKLMNLYDGLRALKEQIALSEDQDLTSELQRQLEKKQQELNSIIAQIENLTSSPGTILKIIELQYELWKFQNNAANGTRSNREYELQGSLEDFINKINNRAGENTKLILKIVTLRSQVEHLEALLAKTYNSTLPNKLLKREELINELTSIRTKLQKYISELNVKNPSNARLILTTTDVYKNLKRIEKENHDDKAASSLTLSLLQIYLQNKDREYAFIKDKVKELERELQLMTKECSGLKNERDQLKTEVEQKIVELNKTKDAEIALILDVFNLYTDVRALRKQILEAEDPEVISDLQRQLEEKQDKLKAITAEMNQLIANPRIILEIIALQNQIWDLQNKDTNGTAGDLIRDLQNRMTRLISQIDSRDQENTKLTLKIMNLQSQVKHLQNLLSNRDKLQTSEIRELTSQLAAKKAEVNEQVDDLKEKNQENAKLILELTDLQIQLNSFEKGKTAKDKENAAIISDLKSQLEIKEEECSRYQKLIQTLDRTLNKTKDHCSDYERKNAELQENLNNKIVELRSKSDSITSLVLQISALTEEREQLKAQQQQNSVSKSQVDELQRAIDKKNEELDKLRKELNSRSSQPQRLLQIITLQTQIEKLSALEQNGTDFSKTAALQEKLNNLIKGIKDDDNENTKLTLEILNQRDEIARLRKQEQRKNQTHAEKIRELDDELAIIRNQIKEKTDLLTKSGTRISDLSAQIMELEMKIGPLESELSALRQAHGQSLAELQRKLNLKERQLEDTESQLQSADSENFQYVIDIAALRAKLKQVETQTAVTSDKKIKELEEQLKIQGSQTKKLEDTNKVLERKLQLMTKECSELTNERDKLKMEVEQKIAELNKTKDAETALILNVFNLQTEVNALRKQILEAEDPEIISELQRQLEEKQDKLMAKTAEMKQLIANPRIILEIIALQNQIWDLQNNDTNGTAGDLIRDLQNRMTRLISQIDSRAQENTKLMLKIMNLQSQVKHLQNLLSNRDKLQTNEIRALTSQLAAKKAEVNEQVNDLKEKNQENAKLILEITDLQIQLNSFEKGKTAKDKENAAIIFDLKSQLEIKEEECSRYQKLIQTLDRTLNKTKDHCSDYERKNAELQENLNNKIVELRSKSDSITSLVLQISALTEEQEQLKAQQQNSVSKSKVDELQRAIDKKNEELDKLRKELNTRSSQPQRLLQIITLQTEIEKLSALAQNGTDFDKTAALQEKLNKLINEIKDEDNENTKLTLEILNQRDEIARLRKQEQRKNQTHAEKIRDLEDELAIIRNQIKEKTGLLTKSGTRISDLSTQIMELHMKIGPLESELSALKQAHSQSLAELQRKLNLKERQLEDTESQLQRADSENFQYVIEIADLRAKLKQVETQTAVTSDKKIKELEEQLKTQGREMKKLEATNKDLNQEVNKLDLCCNQVESDCKDLKRDLQQSYEDIDRLQRQLRQKDARLNNLEQDLQRRIKENNQLQDRFNSLQTEKNKLEETVDELRRTLDDVEDGTIHTAKMAFDPETAHPRIVLSADNTEMSTLKFPQNLPDNPERFDVILGVLGETGFSSGRHYWEISVEGKTCYHLGMTSESSQRKGSPRFKPTDGYWTIILDKQGQYKAVQTTRVVSIQLQTQPATLGILLDYKKGMISFYDSQARIHMYSFVGQVFEGRIYPFVNFCIEDGEAPSSMVLINPGSTDWIK